MTAPKDPKTLKARIVNKEIEYKGFLSLYKVTIEKERHEGGMETFNWLVMDRGHAVAVLAYDPKSDEVVLVNEMRPGVLWAGDHPYTDNLIAGGIGKGETAVEAAVRETDEEAGLVLKDPILVHPGAYVSSGGTSEKIAIVAGIVDMSKAGGIHGCANERENIKSTILKADEFIRQVKTGEIADLKTLVAGYWFIENRLALQLKYAADKVANADTKAGAAKKANDAFKPK